MRYTTIIDITEFPTVYRNNNAVLLYLHLVLRAGWHDSDRDTLRISFRQLAQAVGMTLSATRHAVRVLTEAKLLQRDGDVWRVKKWHIEKPPTPRRKATTATATETNKLHEQLEKQRNEFYDKLDKVVRSMTAAELRSWYGELCAGKSLAHHGVTLRSNASTIDWFKTNIIDKL